MNAISLRYLLIAGALVGMYQHAPSLSTKELVWVVLVGAASAVAGFAVGQLSFHQENVRAS